MMTFQAAESWTTQQLAEFLSVVSSFTEEGDALRGCVERVAEAMNTEVAALVRDGEVVASIGFPAGAAPVEDLVQAAVESRFQRPFGDIGVCTGMCSAVGDGGGSLLVARVGSEGFSQEEGDLLRGMGRVLDLSLRSIRLIGELSERQTLLERLTHLQRSIASRVDLEDVLDAIVTGASELLGDELVDLSLLDPEDPSMLVVAASVGYSPQLLDHIRRTPVEVGIAGQAVMEHRLVVAEEYGADPRRMPDVAVDGLRAVISAPIHQRGELVGALSLGTRRLGRRYSEMEREAVLAFAEHAGLALNDAKAIEETTHQAFHDPLTGLANRALLVDRLAQARTRASSAGSSVGVLFADLDSFKTVNDSLGHAAGDQLLVIVGQRLASVVGPTDTVARFGGDEFGMLNEDVREPIEHARLARQALAALEKSIEIEGREVFTTASIGVAVGLEEPEELLRNADLAMYEAKSRGKGTFSSFVPAMHSAMLRRVELEADLRRAINANELLLHYQPLVGLPDGRVTGAEALVRWNHPEKGLIPPNEFIPVAEDSDLALTLGRVVLVEACHQAKRVQEILGDGKSITMAVNISSQQLTSQWLVHEVARAIEDTGVDPTCLVLEITEGAVMGELRPILATLEGLKQLGVKLAIDDFGTGWSSLSRLHSFPIDKLKVDQSFISGVRSRGDDAPIAAAVVAMARSLHLATVAEGVETVEQLALVDQLGCREIQGYLFSRPIPSEEYEELLRNSPDLRLPGSEAIIDQAQLSSRMPGVRPDAPPKDDVSLEGSIAQLKEAIGADLVSLFEMRWDERALVVTAAAGSEGLHLSPGERFEWDGSPCQKFIESGSHAFTDLAVDFPQHLIAIRGGRAYAAVPVQGDGGVLLGTLSAVKRSPEPFAEGLLTTLRTVARLLTPDLEALAAKPAAAATSTSAASPAA